MDLTFQVVSWHACDIDYENEDDDDEDEESSDKITKDTSRYLVKVFGVTADGKSVSVNITDFPPYFFIKINGPINDYTLRRIKESLVTKLPYALRDCVLDFKVMKKKEFWGFTNNRLFNFVRITFKNLKTFKRAINIMARDKHPLYESNIEPFLRLIHNRDIDPCGWITVPAGKYTQNLDLLPSRCKIDVTCKWNAIQKANVEKIAPLLVAGFDIECTSSHGDFPVARKSYKKLAYDLFEYFKAHNDDDDIRDKVRAELLNAFKPSDEESNVSKVYPKHLDMRQIEKSVQIAFDEIYSMLSGKLSYRPQGFKLKDKGEKTDVKEPTRDEIIQKITQKFGEYSEDGSWSGMFPPLEGDPVIQIGTTIHSYGSTDVSTKHVITLGSCDPIPGITVEACSSERELLLRWRDYINKQDPDVLIGYNIFGFDLSYMYERAKELGIAGEFCKIGRIKDQPSEYVVKTLSSSALGDNILKYIAMEGRVLIDMMKVIQRDHKLDSFKLDFVANNFLGGKLLLSDNGIVFDNVKGIKEDGFVKIDDCKRKVKSIKQLQKGYLVELYEPFVPKKMSWGLAKDDITPKQIFECQKGTSADRALIAKYCIQDCALCNYLIMKLETLANNIGMANVCSVPLEYIFMRGQGIKIFSLVAKQCRSEDFMIPALKVNKDEEQEDEDGYEGAIVLEPKQGIYLDEPISVLDYASLYPSSMISENLSHDCIVLDPKYDNLEGYEYLDISYDLYEKQGDKKVKSGVRTCRFVQLPEKGMIPRILMHLLKQRKLTRKKIEFQTVVMDDGTSFSGLVSETGDQIKVSFLDGKSVMCEKSKVVSTEDTYDEFQKAVLDGLQLAYKVTANSLYGQCGARTSQIYMKDIAACTTATGRKMILMAKEFIEKKSVEYKYPYDVDVVYGDSVTGDTPLIIRYPDGHIDIKTIETVSKDWQPYQNFKPWDSDRHQKQQSFIDAEIWADGWWAKIHRVIRHKTNKKLYRVNTFEGSVDVTEDHSLVGIDGGKVKPSECIVGETLISHTFPTEFPVVDIQMAAQGVPFVKEAAVTKTCGSCKVEKDETMFYKSYIKKDGTQSLTNTCKLCTKQKQCKRIGKEFDGALQEKVLNYHVPSYTITKFEAWVWGIFFGDGSCGYYECDSGDKYSWAINNSNLKYLEIARKYLLAIEPSDVVKDFKVLDTIGSSGVYKLVPSGSIKYMVEKYRSLMYDKDKYKKVPDIILNAPQETKLWFMRGYLAADGTKGARGLIEGKWSFACLGKIGAQGLYFLMKSLGWKDIRVNIQKYKENTYWISNISQTIEKKRNKVLKMFEIGNTTQETFVYDIETSAGRFHGGVGSIKLWNTDSLLIKLSFKDQNGVPIKGKEAIPLSRDLGIKISHEFKKHIKPPHDLEWEKLFYPFILFSKKRYCANKYEHDDNKYKMNSMGIVLKRRDNAQIVKTIYGGILDIILNKQDIKGSVGFLKQKLDELAEGKFPLEELVITKSLKSEYKDPTKIAHKVLAERMGERDPGNKPQSNDRIPYVYIQVEEKKGQKILQGNRIEHPEYIRANPKEAKPDYTFYITNQIMTPVLQLYALVLEDLDGYRKGRDYYKELYDKLLKEKEGDPKKAKDRWQDLREDDVKKLLFDPVLTKLDNKKKGNRMITDYFKFA